MNTYILQKDLPDVKAGKVLSWGEAINAYYIPTNTPTVECKYKFPKHIVENDDGTWFKLKEEKIIVTGMWDLDKVYPKQCKKTAFETSKPIPEDKFQAIREAIEFVINDQKCNQ